MQPEVPFADYIRVAVEKAPPLTEEQQRELFNLLRPSEQNCASRREVAA